jgi:hypothetical protein
MGKPFAQLFAEKCLRVCLCCKRFRQEKSEYLERTFVVFVVLYPSKRAKLGTHAQAPAFLTMLKRDSPNCGIWTVGNSIRERQDDASRTMARGKHPHTCCFHKIDHQEGRPGLLLTEHNTRPFFLLADHLPVTERCNPLPAIHVPANTPRSALWYSKRQKDNPVLSLALSRASLLVDRRLAARKTRLCSLQMDVSRETFAFALVIPSCCLFHR